jgi:phage gpG-like protein
MPVTLHISSNDGENVIRRELLRFEEGLDRPETALRAAGDVLREATEAQFETEGFHASGGWPPLAASTVIAKRFRRSNLFGPTDTHILVATGRLRDALTKKFDPEHIERIDSSGTSLTFGAVTPYGVYHQSERPRTRLPRRPPVAPNEDDKRRIVKDMQRALIEQAKGR